MALRNVIFRLWRRFWIRFAGRSQFGRFAAGLTAWGTMPCHGREFLARLHPRGFIDPTAALPSHVRLGNHVYVGDRVVAFRTGDGGDVELQDRVCLYGDTFIQTGSHGKLRIGTETHVQPGCYFAAFISDITVGRRVEIASQCAFYSYDHGMKAGDFIMNQPLQSRGGISIGDGAWLGHGVKVMHGVDIGAGAVIGAGSVVTRSIPANAIAAGVPARVLKYRT